MLLWHFLVILDSFYKNWYAYNNLTGHAVLIILHLARFYLKNMMFMNITFSFNSFLAGGDFCRLRPNKIISVFRVTCLKILGRVGAHIFFLEKKNNFMHFERQNAFQNA